MAKASHSPRSSLADARSPRRIHATTISSTSSSGLNTVQPSSANTNDFFNSLLGVQSRSVVGSVNLIAHSGRPYGTDTTR
jgi:hypothetical protein